MTVRGDSQSHKVIVGESQEVGRIEQRRNLASELARRPGQLAVPAESRSDVSAHSL